MVWATAGKCGVGYRMPVYIVVDVDEVGKEHIDEWDERLRARLEHFAICLPHTPSPAPRNSSSNSD